MIKPSTDKQLAELDEQLAYMASGPSQFSEYTYAEVAALRERLRLAESEREELQRLLSARELHISALNGQIAAAYAEIKAGGDTAERAIANIT